MDGGARPPNRSFRVSPVDRLGRPISPVVLDGTEPGDASGAACCGFSERISTFSLLSKGTPRERFLPSFFNTPAQSATIWHEKNKLGWPRTQSKAVLDEVVCGP